jgi:hypothetical protein
MRDRSLDGPNYFTTLNQLACAGVTIIVFVVVLATMIVRTM